MWATSNDTNESAPITLSASRVMLTLALIAALATGAWLLIAQTAGAARVVSALGNVSPWWLAGCFALEVVSFAAYASALEAVARLDRGPAIGRRAALRLMLTSLGATRLVATAGAGGLVVVFWAFRQLGLDLRAALSRVLGLNILVFAVFGLMGWIASVVALCAPVVAPGVPAAMSATWSIGVPLCVAAAAWVSRQRPARPEVSAPHWVSRGARAVVDGLVVVREIAAQARHHGRLFASVSLYWLADVACLWSALIAVGARPGVVSVCLAYATGYVATAAPLPTGGFGAVEAAVTASLVLVGTPFAIALASVAVWRAFSFWLPTVPALVALTGLSGLGREFRQRAASTLTS